jgi:hypothetical protein
MNKIEITLQELNDIRNKIAFLEGIAIAQEGLKGESALFDATEALIEMLNTIEKRSSEYNEEPK